MSSRIVQFTDNNGLGGGFPVDAAFNSDVTQGDLIVACIAAVLSIDADISILDSQDNEYQQAVTSNPVFPDSPADTTARMAVYYARAKGVRSVDGYHRRLFIRYSKFYKSL